MFCILYVSFADGYIYSDTLGIFYKVFYDPLLNQPDAKVFCQTECGTLLKIDTEEKQKYVEDHMELKKYSGYTTFYLDAEKNGTSWVWSDGSAINMFFWAPGQPNNSAAKAIRVILTKERKWDDGSGTFKRGFICQRSFQ